MSRLKDMTCVVTGASSGFGMEIAKQIVNRGGKVVLGARREDRLIHLCEELGSDNAVYHVTDVTNEADVGALVKKGIQTFGQIGGLVNNAGIMPISKIAAGRVREWDRMIDVNIKGVLYGIHAVLAHMLENGNGVIVNMSSVSGITVAPSFAVYSATKHAVKAISEGLRRECAGEIQVTTIFPGAFLTELPNSIEDPETSKSIGAGNLVKVAQSPVHVAKAVIFALEQDPKVAVNEIVIRPTAQI